MNREAFEKIPEIAKLIEDSGAFYCNKGNWCLCPDATMYEMLRDEDTLDYWKLDDTPQ